MRKELIIEIKDVIQKDRNCVVIVEGKKDRKVLQELGFTNILTLEKLPMYSLIELVSKEVIILTDFDKKGKELYLKIKDLCSRRGVKVKTKLRCLLLRTNITNIEDIKPHSFI
jgi:5S rRNA maturation endonuclease (ribonuclease M5)